MKKALKYFCLFLLILVWVNGWFGSFHRKLFAWGVFPDDFRYGDLYRLSLLPDYKSKKSTCLRYCESGNCNKLDLNLYALGDSFLEPARIDSTDFAVKHYHYTHWEETFSVSLDTTQKNILLVESVERNILDHFKTEIANIATAPPIDNAKGFDTRSWQFTVEERIERLLFSNDIALFFKELKALLNYKLFNRKASQISLSPGDEHIFLALDTDASQPHSSFYPVNQTDLDGIVNALNGNYDKFKAMGFDEVYLSLIPNKTSILAPTMGEYNHLIELIQNRKDLKIKVIDVFTTMKQEPLKMYDRGDTHWSCEGREIWLKAIHRELTTAAQ